jgi:hypothetical protein
MRLLGLHGPMHCGKDTAFEFIREDAERRGLVAARQGFADRLKLSGMRLIYPEIRLNEEWLLPLADMLKERGTVSFVYPDPVDPDGPQHVVEIDGRTFWERMGTESHRAPELFGGDCWVDLILPKATYSGYEDANDPFWDRVWGSDTDLAVITDVRFVNEAERIQALGGEVWYIDRPDGDGHDDGHISRKKLPDYLIRRTIPNDGTLDDYKVQLAEALDNYTKDTA